MARPGGSHAHLLVTGGCWELLKPMSGYKAVVWAELTCQGNANSVMKDVEEKLD